MIPFPAIDPIAIAIGPIAVRWYALAYISGIVLAWWYMVRLLRQKQLWAGETPPAQKIDIDDYIVWATLGIILGGRIGYVLVYDQALLATNPLGVFAVWRGGMSFHGGLLGVVIATALFCWKRKIRLISFGDLVAAAAPFGLFFGRIANFVNGELWGRPTDAPWGVVFPYAGDAPRHPSQLYEAALEGFVLFLLLRSLTHGSRALKHPGLVSGVFLLGYALARMAVEYWAREPDAQMPALPFGLTTGLLLSLPMALVGLWLMLRARRHA
jgi:phosphatidylglycerol:prolipoprotein diacylglycerol transferase